MPPLVFFARIEYPAVFYHEFQIVNDFYDHNETEIEHSVPSDYKNVSKVWNIISCMPLHLQNFPRSKMATNVVNESNPLRLFADLQKTG